MHTIISEIATTAKENLQKKKRSKDIIKDDCASSVNFSLMNFIPVIASVKNCLQYFQERHFMYFTNNVDQEFVQIQNTFR